MPFLAPAVAAVGAALAPVASFVAGLGGLGQLLVGIGLQLVRLAFVKKPKTQQSATGTKLDVQYGADRPREIAIGLVANAGHEIYTNTYDKANKKLQRVYVLSDFRTSGLNRVAVNGEWKTINFGANDPDKGWRIAGIDGEIYLKYYDGTQTAADPNLVEESNPPGRWTNNHIGKGISYVIVTAVYDAEKLSSFPTFLFEFKGAPLYDVRKDSTAGGSGPHRWNDQNTWEYSENPIIAGYNYERGFYIGSQLMIGKGMPSSDLPPSPWMSAANICDEIVDGAVRYRLGCFVTAADGVTHQDNLSPIFQAAGSDLVERVDGDQPIVGAAQPIVQTLTDDDLIVDENHTFQAKRSRSELVNSVFGTFNAPAQVWAATAYAPQTDATALAVDRERHAVQIDFATVFTEPQAVRLAGIAIRESRYQASATIVVRPRFVALEAGDWIRWNSARYGDRKYRVNTRTLAPINGEGARNVTLILEEVGDSIYDSSVVIPERPIGTLPAGPVYTLTVEDFILLATSVTGSNGRKYPALQAQWAAIDDPTVTGVRVEYWKSDEPQIRIQKEVPVSEIRVIMVEGVLPVTGYTAHACVITDPPRPTVWSREWSATTLTEDLAFDAELDLSQIRELVAYGQQVQADLYERIQALGKDTALITSIATNDMGKARAAIYEESYTRATETSAQARRTTLVEASLQGLQSDVSGYASALNTLDVRVDATEAGIIANAQAITGVTASVGNLFASGLISFQAVAQSGSGSTAYSRIAILTKAGDGDNFKESGIYIDTTPTTSTVLIRADKFLITDSNKTQSAVPFAVENGYVKLSLAYFQQLISINGKMVVNGTNGTIEIYD